MPDLAGAIASLPPGNAVRTAKVTQAQPLKLNVGGGVVEDAGSLAAVNVGDTVACIRQGQTWLVLGVVSPAVATWGTLAGVRGSTLCSFSNTTVVADISFGQTLPRVPAVIGTNLASGSGSTARTATRAINKSTTGFQVFAWKTDVTEAGAAWSMTNVPVEWWAIL